MGHGKKKIGFGDDWLIAHGHVQAVIDETGGLDGKNIRALTTASGRFRRPSGTELSSWDSTAGILCLEIGTCKQ